MPEFASHSVRAVTLPPEFLTLDISGFFFFGNQDQIMVAMGELASLFVATISNFRIGLAEFGLSLVVSWEIFRVKKHLF